MFSLEKQFLLKSVELFLAEYAKMFWKIGALISRS